MPIRPFELSKSARKRRNDSKVFFCSALIGIILGALVTLLGSPSPFSQHNLYKIILLVFCALAVVLYSIKVVIQPDDIHHILTIYLAYSKDKGMLVPITNRLGFAQQGFMIMRDGAKVNPEPIEILKKGDVNGIRVLFMDLVIYGLFDWLSQKYMQWWAPKIRYTGIAYGRQSFKGRNEVSSNVIRYSDLPEEMREKNFFFRLYSESLMLHRQLQFSVPKYTKFRWTQQNEKVKKCMVSLCNKYCNLNISISFQGWGVGLFPLWGKFVLAKGRQETDSIMYLQEHYAHTVFEMDFHATFNWFWSLTNKSDDYFNWIEDMRDGLDDFFSFEREYDTLEKSDEKFELE